jgi:hypothetical protein
MLNKDSDSAFKGRRMAVFEPHPDLATNPSLVCLLQALNQSGAQIDLFMPHSGPYPMQFGNVSRYPYPEAFSFWHGGVRCTLQGWRDSARSVQADDMFSAYRYDLIFGVDSAGIIKGYKYAKRHQVPLAYLCFEIFFREELTLPKEIQEKGEECAASQFADLVVIQDRWRARLLAAENGIPFEKFVFLPVSPCGPTKEKKSNYLRAVFGIAEEKSIVLHSGSFYEWTYAEELLENVKIWPEDFVLVIHTRFKPRVVHRSVRKVQRSRLPNVYLSCEPVAQEEYDKLVSSADIGLVLYKPMGPSRFTQKNIETIGLASGKFSSYLKNGIPVISISQAGYADLLKDYAYGEDLPSFSQMADALRRIRSKHSFHKSEALRLFREKLDFHIHWPTMKSRLIEVMK